MWTVVLIIVMVIGSVLLGGFLIDAPGRNEIRALTFSDVNFKNLRNGKFIGEYKGTKSHTRDVKFEITVSGGKIKNIKILKGALDKDGIPVKFKGELSIDNLFTNSVQSQTLQVDVISGATITSKAHLKALENALEQAQL